MRNFKFLTWLDIRRFIRQKTQGGNQMPEWIVSISCFSDVIEISIRTHGDQSQAETILKEWFGDWYDLNKQWIQLDFGDSVIPIEFVVTDFPFQPKVIHPFWSEIAYLNTTNCYEDNEGINLSPNITLPKPYDRSPNIIAFYSFKGGVGRTLHLAAYLFALLQRAKEVDRKVKILVIDADLEAPGLTYWDHNEKQLPTVSFIDFLEFLHYSPLPREQTLKRFADEIKKSPRDQAGSTFYFLPAYRLTDAQSLDLPQLLDVPVLPEHLARSPGNPWMCGDAIHQLGNALDADYVLIDLRAGLSEISSPIIFDPRMQRFFVTTAAQQSVLGLSLVLEQISRMAPSSQQIQRNEFYDPTVIITFLTPELKAAPAFDDVLVQLRSSYQQSIESEDYTDIKGLSIYETDFSQELLNVNNWENAKNKLASTSVMRIAKEWADSDLLPNTSYSEVESENMDDIQKLSNVCKKYEFAESGEGEKLLITNPLKNMAVTFQQDLPHLVSLGAKGSGKTFIYLQLSRFQYWEKFTQVALKIEEPEDPYIHIFPLLESNRLKSEAEKVVAAARQEVKNALGIESFFSASDFRDEIIEFTRISSDELEWTRLWIRLIAKSIGFENIETVSIMDSLSRLNNFIKSKNKKVIFLFDGLEDVFQKASSNHQQQTALSSLINLPKRLHEIRQCSFGLIIFLRRDFLRYAITQNVGQFENLYKSYDLSWDFNSFLKLVYWIAGQSETMDFDTNEIDNLGLQELLNCLEKVWGKKLGQDNSKEAHTANWVFAALSDLKGYLQARDIVRFLYHASTITIENRREVQFERWSSDRLLPPQSIRRALLPCSRKKMEEMQEEYPELKTWGETLAALTSAQRKVPFTLDEIPLERETMRTLEAAGILYEDRDKDDICRYYMPEIVRLGLDFTPEKGARPRVLALKRKAMGGRGFF